MIRTLDLLNFINLVETSKDTIENFRSILMSESGWLRVDSEKASVIREPIKARDLVKS